MDIVKVAEALAEAQRIIQNARLPLAGFNSPAWEKMKRIEAYLKTQQRELLESLEDRAA